ncbi:hypothetical protein [Aeromicrobium massiliense]|uniref:hypothetical protein n=1 Tax=Aeromicrobium massiliense TaxID=1464554 RepID=UPI00030A8264|nr:hypothetical protein [Aeromicrobium massiliense]
MKGALVIFGSDNVEVHQNDVEWCSGAGSLDGAHSGAQVTITNAQGEKVGIGELDDGEWMDRHERCQMDFTIAAYREMPAMLTFFTGDDI